MNLVKLSERKVIEKPDGSKMIFLPGEYNMEGDLLLEGLALDWVEEGSAEYCASPQDEEPEEPEPYEEPDPDDFSEPEEEAPEPDSE